MRRRNGLVRRSAVSAASAVAALLAVAITAAACSTGTPPPTATSSQSTLVPTSPSSTTIPTTTPSESPSTPATTSTTVVTTRPSPTATITQPITSTTVPRPTATTPAPVACSIPSSLLGKDLETIPTTRKVVALTFDAGASNAGVASILGTLAAQGVPATFFMTGDFVDAHPASARAMARHPIGNHTYNHPDLTTLTDSRVRTEIRSAATRIKAVTGQDPRRYFRFPFGARDSRTIRLVNAECYVPFRWTVDTLGWKGTSGGQSVATVVARVLGAARPGEIVLMHVGANPDDGSTLDAAALPQVISGLRAKGYGFVTLEAVLPAAP